MCVVPMVTYVINILECIEHIIGETRQHVDHEPTLQIVHSDNFRIGDDLPTRSHKRCVEIEDNVDKEDDVNDTVDDEKRNLVHGFVFKGGVIGDRHSCVKSQKQDDPVPNGFEQAVMKNDMRWRFWRF